MDLEKSELEFRRVEAYLDSVLAESKNDILSSEITFGGQSNRKRLNVGRGSNQLLWAYQFNKTWGSEKYFVSLILSYGEPAFSFGDEALQGFLWYGKGSQHNRDSKIHSGEFKKESFHFSKAGNITSNQLTSMVTSKINEAASKL